MPLLTPYLTQQRRLTGRLQHLGPLALLTSPAPLHHQRDKAGHISVLTHGDLSFAAPDSARRRPAQVRGHLKAVFAALTDYRHGNFVDESRKALLSLHEIFSHSPALCGREQTLEATYAEKGFQKNI